MSQKETAWAELLKTAVTQPGRLLAAYTAFWHYSLGNQMLALIQCEQRGLTPGPMATFQGWKEKGRVVKKGEKALELCMPLTCRRRDEPASDDAYFTLFVFKRRWFVFAQTEGAENVPPALPQWDKAQALATLDIQEAPFNSLNGNLQGYARQRTIAISPVAALPWKTLFHEMGHIVLGHTTETDVTDGPQTPKDLREVEAESVALLCCEALGLPGAEYARGYIQHWWGQHEIPERSAQRIFGAADRILKAGNKG